MWALADVYFLSRKCGSLAPYARLKILEIISRVYRSGLSDGLG